MSTIRQLLECLERPSLMRLMRERGLPPTRKNDERRTSLVRSYRGEVEALLQDLNRGELVSIFRRLSFVQKGDGYYYLPNPGKYRLDELHSFALRAFAGRPGRIPSEFRQVPEQNVGVAEYGHDEDGDGDEDEDGDGDEDEDGDDEDGDDEEVSPARGAHGDVTEAWSRPRMMSRVFQKVGMDAPQRLRTPRFQELITALRARGIEVCRADDPACAPLTEDAESPGIAAKLRLRKALAPRASRPVPHTDEGVWPRETGPAIVIQTGERPVSQRIPRPADYELALLRLQLLTAVPSAERGNLPEWPGAYLAAATRGLSIRPEEEPWLRIFATGRCRGTHSPYESISQLAPVLRPSEWKELIEDFVALNPFEPDLVRAIVAQIEKLIPATTQSPVPSWQSVAPIAEDLRQSPPANEARVREPLAASGRGASSAPPKPPATNVRDLGALTGMFDDE